MLKNFITTGVAALGIILSMQASAHQNHHHNSHDNHRYHKPTKPVYNVDHAQRIQATLINNGVKNRSLTHYEEKKLRQEQRQIAHLESQYRRNGLQKWEINTLKQRLQNAAKRIKSFMNNREYRPAPHHKKRKHYKQSKHHNRTSRHNTANGSFTLWISK